MGDFCKETLVEQFRNYLDELDDDDGDDRCRIVDGNTQSDLYHLFLELTALKNEVRIESRQVKNALDQFRELFAVVEAGQTSLRLEMTRRQEAEAARGQDTMKSVLLEFLELRDRLQESVVMMQKHRPSLWVRLFSAESAWVAGLCQGQEMFIRRLDQILAGQRAHAFDSVGKPLDPQRMRAIAVVDQEGVADGVVVTEHRKGFLWHGQLLRPAEVQVNRNNRGVI